MSAELIDLENCASPKQTLMPIAVFSHRVPSSRRVFRSLGGRGWGMLRRNAPLRSTDDERHGSHLSRWCSACAFESEFRNRGNNITSQSRRVERKHIGLGHPFLRG